VDSERTMKVLIWALCVILNTQGKRGLRVYYQRENKVICFPSFGGSVISPFHVFTDSVISLIYSCV
jgi:hypothetical protein